MREIILRITCSDDECENGMPMGAECWFCEKSTFQKLSKSKDNTGGEE